MSRFIILFLARGLNIGLIPKAPGTFGSLLGFAWALALFLPGRLAWAFAGAILGVMAAVWICDRAELLLQQKDPGAIVLDEIVAYPLCYLAFYGWQLAQGGPFSGSLFLSSIAWWQHLLVFATFRLFDILKPWPVRTSQKLRGGLGVVMDDLLAALYTSLASLIWLR